MFFNSFKQTLALEPLASRMTEKEKKVAKATAAVAVGALVGVVVQQVTGINCVGYLGDNKTGGGCSAEPVAALTGAIMGLAGWETYENITNGE